MRKAKTWTAVGEKRKCFSCLHQVGFGLKVICRRLWIGQATASRLLNNLKLHRHPQSQCRRRIVIPYPRRIRLSPRRHSKWHTGYTEQERQMITKRICGFLAETRLLVRTGKLKAERGKAPLAAKYFRDKYQSDPLFNIKVRLRRRLRKFLDDGEGKEHSMEVLVGCSWEYLWDYLRANMHPRMSMAKRSSWHIDHIIPCSRFDLTKPEEQRRCFHFSNLRPLWRRANIRKNDAITDGQTKLLLSA